jgi:hypothetical protein
MYINCPVRQLADGAIEKQLVTGLLPQHPFGEPKINSF